MKLGIEHCREKLSNIDDPRITKDIKYIRKFRIDELPQLWNVSKRDMSFVGPMAIIHEEFIFYHKEIPYFNFRHNVKSGTIR